MSLNVVALVIAIVLGFVAYRSSRTVWRSVDTPTVPTGNVVIGECEVLGKARLGPGLSMIHSPISGAGCVWWQAVLEEEVGGAKSKTWKTRETVQSSSFFAVDDGSGPVVVSAVGASIGRPIVACTSKDELPTTLSLNDLHAVSKGHGFTPTHFVDDRSLLEKLVGSTEPDMPISNYRGKWRVTENWFTEDSDVYVIGYTTFDFGAHRAYFAQGRGKPLRIYGGKEKQLVRNARLLMFVATVGFLVALVFAVHVFSIAGVVLVALAFAIRSRNRVVRAVEQYRAGQHLVGIATTKRGTLIPQLNAIVEAVATHEQGQQEDLAKLRGTEIDSSGFTVLQERYPSLKTDSNFRQLQTALVDVENDVAVANGFVSDAKAIVHTRMGVFPDGLIARLTGVRIPIER